MHHRTSKTKPQPAPERPLYRARSGPITWADWQGDRTSPRLRRQVNLLALFIAEQIPTNYRIDPRGSRRAVEALLAAPAVKQVITDLNELSDELRPAKPLLPLEVLAFCLNVEGALLAASRR